MKEITIPVTEFKAKCLQLLVDVEKKGDRITITKRGRPVAQVGPAAPMVPSLRDSWKGKVKILGDIVNFHDDPWSVDTE